VLSYRREEVDHGGRALTPHRETISLEEQDGSYAITVEGAPLMSTRRHASAEMLPELACARLRVMRAPRVLIGGVGFGFTLKLRSPSFPAPFDRIVDHRFP
jgi:spermidine synthase